MSEILLRADKVGKKFHRDVAEPVEVLKNLDLELARGEQIAIVGKSGAGKSTLLHILGTLEAPSEGQVLFEGKDVFRFSDNGLSTFRNRSLGFVFQFHYLMLEFTALENVLMPALLAGESRAQAKPRAIELLQKVGLEHRFDHKPGQLSGGEQQRVAIARALMMRPKLLLTDEMTGNLDPDTEGRVFDLVKALQLEYGIALISVTHDEALAQTFPKVYHLKSGQLHRKQ